MPAKKGGSAKPANAELNDDERVSIVRAIAGHPLKTKRALEAVTHRAYRNDHPSACTDDYERLEFLGDAVLDLVAATLLLERFPTADEGELTQRRAAYVSEPALAQAAMKSGLADVIRLSRAQTNVGDDRLPSICADVVEAVIGASFIEGGLEVATLVTQRILGDPPEVLEVAKRDEKTVLQERIQAAIGEVPTYEVERSDGPDHAPTFIAHVRVREHALGSAEGLSKKLATQAAAKLANEALRAVSDKALRKRLQQ